MTTKKKCNSESNSFVAAAEQVCLQPPIVDRRQVGTSSCSSVEADLSLRLKVRRYTPVESL